MIKKAFIYATIPFLAEQTPFFSEAFSQKAALEGWERQKIQGDFLLNHINSSFAANVACYSKPLEGLDILVPIEEGMGAPAPALLPLQISKAQIFCFDTQIGFCSLYIPINEDMEEADLTNACSVLHCSAKHADPKKGKPILHKGKENHLCHVAYQLLQGLIGPNFSLFPTQNEESLRRINLFSAALCAKDSASSADQLCYQLANAYDNRDQKITFDPQALYHQHDYTRWAFSKRGCAAVGNLTGTPANDRFLQERWFFSAKTNYFYLYLMALHQKFAIYHYLNEVAEDPEMEHLKINQKSMMDFNSKYVFTIVSDEQFVQDVYLRFKKAANVDDLYTELLEQLKRMFDYAKIKADRATEAKNQSLNLISVIISIVCSVSVIFDSINLFTMLGFTFGFHSLKGCLFSGIIFLEILLFLGLLLFVCFSNKRAK